MKTDPELERAFKNMILRLPNGREYCLQAVYIRNKLKWVLRRFRDGKHTPAHELGGGLYHDDLQIAENKMHELAKNFDGVILYT